MRNISDGVVDYTTTHILCSIIFSPKNRAVYKIMWKIMKEPDRSQMTKYYGSYALHVE
jgi:hypothetical protein